VGRPGHGPSERPTRARLIVLTLLCSLSFVLYLDRVCIGQAVKPIEQEMGISHKRMSVILMAFTLAYGLFEIPVGHWGDRIGARRVITRIALTWSGFTVLTAACWNFWSLLVVRFLFGAGEAGAYPNVARVIRRWFPPAQRGRVQGLFMTCAQLGAAATPVAAAYLIQLFGWRVMFVSFGLVGVIWAVAFWVWFRDDPQTHPAVNAAELALIGPSVRQSTAGDEAGIPWRAIRDNRTLWLLGTIMVLISFNSYLYLSWYPTYLQEARGVTPLRSGGLSSLVLFAGSAGMLTGGVLADRITRLGRDAVKWRRRLGVGAFALAAGWLFLGSRVDSTELSSVLTALSLLTMYCAQASWWTSLTEISGRHVGSFFGLANGLGIFGAMASQFLCGAFADWRAAQGYTGRDQWDPVFDVYIGVLLLAATAWAAYRPGPLSEEP
jgi:ACS family glucarate transporter-like MFS transporter